PGIGPLPVVATSSAVVVSTRHASRKLPEEVMVARRPGGVTSCHRSSLFLCQGCEPAFRPRTAGPGADGGSGCDGSGNSSGRRGPAARWVPDLSPRVQGGGRNIAG